MINRISLQTHSLLASGASTRARIRSGSNTVFSIRLLPLLNRQTPLLKHRSSRILAIDNEKAHHQPQMLHLVHFPRMPRRPFHLLGLLPLTATFWTLPN